MKRREFIAGLGVTLASSVVAKAQQTKRTPIVSVLWHGTRERELANPFFHWFRDGFAEVGYKVGIDIIIEDSFADESDARYNVLAPELVARRPDVLVAITGPPAMALANAHGDIPLVFVWVSDPLGLGLVDGIGKHSQNATGNSSYGRDLAAKRLQILREVRPSLSHLALLVNPKTRYETDRDLAEYRRVAAGFKIVVDRFEIGEFDQVHEAFAKLKEAGCDGAVLSVTSIFGLLQKELAEAAIALRVPLVGNLPLFAANGSLLGYGAPPRDGFAIGARYVKRVLAGERAQDIPIEQPTRYELAVNMKTAEAIGIEVPESIMQRADQVIE